MIKGDKMQIINERIYELRKQLKAHKLDAYLVNSSDPHMSESVSERWQSRKFISGFTGSAGTVIITENFAGLWTDGRYFIQGEKELENSEVKLFKMRQPDVPTVNKWLFDNLEENSKIGLDGKVFSTEYVSSLHKKLNSKKICVSSEIDLIDTIWNERPARPKTTMYEHDIKFAGKSRKQKFNDIRKKLASQKVDALIISALDELAWTFNIRGNDVAYNPVSLGFGIITHEKALLFTDKDKIQSKLNQSLSNDSVEILGYNEIYKFVAKLDPKLTIQYDSRSLNQAIFEQIKDFSLKKGNLIAKLKSQKNEVEIDNIIQALITDCTAITKFNIWLKQNISKIQIDEFEAAAKLLCFRQKARTFKGESFVPISAYQANAAMMHYSANQKNSAKLKPKGFYLIDSGGQYQTGTTDITRTFALGELSYEQKKHFTLVLKAVIDLTSARFLKGTTGANLDILARMPLWKEGIDYKCGTGHGVGFFLNVHEGPQNFSQALENVSFEPGMITTVEPGIYLENLYGIRIENMLLTLEYGETEFGKWLKFETISFCPIDKDAILVEMLTDEQLEWINQYHQTVYQKISSGLNKKEAEILLEMTSKLKR